MAGPTVAVVGATGAVGRELLAVLEEREFPISELRPLASNRRNGRTVAFRGKDIAVEPAGPESFNGVDVVFSAAGASVSRELAPKAVESGAVVIDKSAAWRYEDDIPLVVPEVNGDDIALHKGIIACPNCSTIQMVVALAPVHREHAIGRVVVSTYQSVSGAGAGAMLELDAQAQAIVEGHEPNVEVLPRQIAFNVIPEVETFRAEDGYTSEEWKLANETRKIMHAPEMRISATCVRVPVHRGHSEAVSVEFSEPVSADEVRRILAGAPGVKVVDDISTGAYPTALDAAGNDDVWVGRIRNDVSTDYGVVFWVVSDNLRKGAATNAVQIAENL
jgi:aspartate-semialdehyde dehydrogenase